MNSTPTSQTSTSVTERDQLALFDALIITCMCCHRRIEVEAYGSHPCFYLD